VENAKFIPPAPLLESVTPPPNPLPKLMLKESAIADVAPKEISTSSTAKNLRLSDFIVPPKKHQFA
jgi:hypothetical protein